jgi:hypothetical protein
LKDAEIMLPPSWKGEVEKTIKEATKTTAERQDGQHQENAAKTAAEIKAINDAYKARCDKSERHDHIKRAIDIATVVLLIGTVIFTGLSWCVFRNQLRVAERSYITLNNSYVSASRAWIAPINLTLDRPVKEKEQISFTLTYLSLGQQPALNLSHKSKSSWVDPLAENIGWDTLKGGENKVCDEIKSVDGMPTTYPSPNALGDTSLTPFKADAALVSGTNVLIVQGCFLYRTFDAIHHSAYCYYLHPAPYWKFGVCADGNDAN